MKLIKALLILSFIVLLVPGLNQGDETEFRTLQVPENFGSVMRERRGEEDKQVIIIQDLHCNSSAQRNISLLIQYFRNDLLKDLVPIVFVEGATGPVSLSFLKSIPDQEIRKEICDYFLEKCYLSGGELAAIFSSRPIEIVGVEDPKIYLRNLDVFQQVMTENEPLLKYLNGLLKQLMLLRNKIYSRRALEFEAKLEDCEKQLRVLCPYLERIAVEEGIELNEYTQFKEMLHLIVLENSFYLQKFLEERKLLLYSLRNVLSRDEQRALIGNSLRLRTGKISVADFYEYLFSTTISKGIVLEDYPQLKLYKDIISLYGKIDNDELIEEIRLIIQTIRSKLLTNPDPKTVSKLLENIRTLISLTELTLTRAKYMRYLDIKPETELDEIVDQIEFLSKQYSIPFRRMTPESDYRKILDLCEQFYLLVTARDKVIFSHIEKGMQENNLTHAIVIVGGFHAEGLASLLKKAGFSYSLVLPMAVLSPDSEKLYTTVMLQDFSLLEQFLSVWSSTLSPRIRGSNKLSDQERVKDFYRLVAVLYYVQSISSYRDSKIDLDHQMTQIEKWAARFNIPIECRIDDGKLLMRWAKSSELALDFSDPFWNKKRSLEEIADYLFRNMPSLLVPTEKQRKDLFIPSVSDGSEKSA